MTDLSAKAALAVTEELTEAGKGLLQRALGPAADVVGREFATAVRDWFARNRARAINRAGEIVAAHDTPAHAVPASLVVRLLEGASREDDPHMQELWASLLANAAVADHPERVPAQYADILFRLTPLAAKTLEHLARSTEPNEASALFYRTGHTVLSALAHDVLGEDALDESGEKWLTNERKIDVAVDILVSQGLATRDWRQIERRGLSHAFDSTVEYRVSRLGQAFFRAVQPPGLGGAADPEAPADGP